MLKIQIRQIKNTFLLLLFAVGSCGKAQRVSTSTESMNKKEEKNNAIIKTGASQIDTYLPILKNKSVAIVGNPTSILFNNKGQIVHIVDTLLKHQIKIKKVFAPEHGFRGKADAGEVVKDGIDIKTQIPIISLYGKNKKPNKEVLEGIDSIVFDIQDVGARFYTYISTLHYIMEACAENNIPIIVLDRPNPNGHYVDGPILQKEYKSFVGLHPIPVVHGMTIGEYAQMINGEKWLKKEVKCELKVITMKNYSHDKSYSLPVKPSPNLPNNIAINLYPSLCFFEGTKVSVGRGTNTQFQVYGAPEFKEMNYSFTPISNQGAKYPKHQNQLCYGEDLRNYKKLDKLSLKWLIQAYKKYPNKGTFFSKFFSKLAGSEMLQKQIEQGMTEEEIRETWQKDLESFIKIRSKYLLYN